MGNQKWKSNRSAEVFDLKIVWGFCRIISDILVMRKCISLLYGFSFIRSDTFSSLNRINKKKGKSWAKNIILKQDLFKKSWKNFPTESNLYESGKGNWTSWVRSPGKHPGLITDIHQKKLCLNYQNLQMRKLYFSFHLIDHLEIFFFKFITVTALGTSHSLISDIRFR